MSDVVVHHIGGGGGSAYAFVIVNYPAGSTVTCTNSSGKKDLSTTKKLFYIKKGTTSCTVTAALNGKSASKTVSNITEGSSTTITLAYELIIYNNGVTTYTWDTKNASLESTYIQTQVTVSFGVYPESYARNNELIDFTSYKTLSFVATRDSSRYSTAYLEIYTSSGTKVYTKEIDVETNKTYTLDISGNTISSGYVRVVTDGAGESGVGGGSYTTTTQVYSIILT